jgi:uncharacterized paraquat-inducible protein A
VTNRTRTYIEHKEVRAIRFDCKECEASVALPLSLSMNFASVDNCPACGKPWIQFGQSSIGGELRRCAESIFSAKATLAHHLSKIENAGLKGFTVSLELSPPDPPDTAFNGKD